MTIISFCFLLSYFSRSFSSFFLSADAFSYISFFSVDGACTVRLGSAPVSPVFVPSCPLQQRENIPNIGLNNDHTPYNIAKPLFSDVAAMGERRVGTEDATSISTFRRVKIKIKKNNF